jgi:hypothetical protein
MSKYKISYWMVFDVYLAKRLKDEGYEFDPYNGFEHPYLTSEDWKNVSSKVKIYNDYRNRINKIVDEISKNRSVVNENV